MKATESQIRKAEELLRDFLDGMPELSISTEEKFANDLECSKCHKNVKDYIIFSFSNYIEQCVDEG